MAYNNKYKITVATQSGAISYLYLLEDGYAGSLIEYPGVSIQLQYIPRSDDLYEAIISSQLSVVIDVTDNVANMPDFTTLNDRKYLVKLFSGTDLQWQGWSISDSVSFSFTTGRRDLSFNAIDGLGMLENIAYSFPSDYTLVDLTTCLNYVLNSLAQIQFPTSLNVISGISFYASGMTNRTTSSSAEPLKQSYINTASFVNDSNIPDNCLGVLTKIVSGFGGKLFQAYGKWYIVSFTQFAQSSYYFTEYNPSATVVASGTKSLSSVIQGFTGNTSGLFFVDNSQYKIIRKGYNKINFAKTVETPRNYFTNWDLKKYTIISPLVNTAFSWTQTFNPALSQIYVKEYPAQAFNSFIMDCGESAISIKPINLPKIGINEIIKISFDAAAIGGPGAPAVFFILKITITNPDTGAFYYLDTEKKWANISYQYFTQSYTPDNNTVNFNLEIPPAPISGNFAFELILAGNTATYWTATIGGLEVQNFQLEVVPSFRSLVTQGYISNSKDYVLDIDLPLGFNNSDDGYYSYRGFLSNSTGLNLKDWYRFEYPLDIYRSLSELVVKQYSNSLNKNVINLDASVMGMATTNGRLSMAMRITATDTDPAQINVSAKKYIISNSTFDLPNNVIQATFLDINNENVSSTVVTTYDTNALTGQVTGFGRLRSNPYATREEAYAAPFTTNLVYTANPGTPAIGDVFYVNDYLGTPFNGASLWWKVQNDPVTYSAYKINSSGIILESYG
jgi:hypothetical protein